MLFEPPFTNLHQEGVIGLFDEGSAMNVIKLIEQVNGNALVHKRYQNSQTPQIRQQATN